jgi:hypothetical protein
MMDRVKMVIIKLLKKTIRKKSISSNCPRIYTQHQIVEISIKTHLNKTWHQCQFQQETVKTLCNLNKIHIKKT